MLYLHILRFWWQKFCQQSTRWANREEKEADIIQLDFSKFRNIARPVWRDAILEWLTYQFSYDEIVSNANQNLY